MRDLIKNVYKKPGKDMGDFWVSFMHKILMHVM